MTSVDFPQHLKEFKFLVLRVLQNPLTLNYEPVKHHMCRRQVMAPWGRIVL